MFPTIANRVWPYIFNRVDASLNRRIPGDNGPVEVIGVQQGGHNDMTGGHKRCAGMRGLSRRAVIGDGG